MENFKEKVFQQYFMFSKRHKYSDTSANEDNSFRNQIC